MFASPIVAVAGSLLLSAPYIIVFNFLSVAVAGLPKLAGLMLESFGNFTSVKSAILVKAPEPTLKVVAGVGVPLPPPLAGVPTALLKSTVVKPVP